MIFPVTLAVSVIRYTPLYEALLSWLDPLMGVFGLPNDATVPLVLGNLLNLYAAIGAMLAMELTVKQVFILALMLGFSHALPVEAAICRRIGVSATLVVLFRLGLAAGAGAAVNLLWAGGEERASYGLVAPQEPAPSGWVEVVTNALQSAASGVLQLAAIVIPVMLLIRILQDVGALDRFAALVRPLLRPFGIPRRGAVTMAGGLLFGLAFGAGVILEEVRKQEFAKRELTLMVLFLCACHAVVEDTLIFVPLGINVIPLLVARVAAAILLTWLIARLWRPGGL